MDCYKLKIHNICLDFISSDYESNIFKTLSNVVFDNHDIDENYAIIRESEHSYVPNEWVGNECDINLIVEMCARACLVKDVIEMLQNHQPYKQRLMFSDIDFNFQEYCKWSKKVSRSNTFKF